jgi:hypothetical protein
VSTPSLGLVFVNPLHSFEQFLFVILTNFDEAEMRNWKRFVPLVAVSFFSNIVRADDVDTIYNRQVEFILSTTTPSSHKIGG